MDGMLLTYIYAERYVASCTMYVFTCLLPTVVVLLSSTCRCPWWCRDFG